MQTRDYQQEAIEAALRTWGIEPWYDGQGEVFRSLILNLATSAGKTIIASKLMETLVGLGYRCAFVADTDELCDQVIKKLRASTGLIASLEKAQDRASMMSDIVVSSAQTLGRDNRLQRFPKDHFDFIFHDECHRASSRGKKINDYFSDAKTCGITATAFRAKLKDLSDFYQTVAYELGTFDLIDRGYITPIKVMTLPVSIDINNVKQSAGADGMDYNAEELDHAIEPYFDSIIRNIKEHAATRQILTFLPLIKTSQKFVAKCQDAGIAARHVDGNSDDRADILEAFERKEFQLLSNSALLTTGWDCCPVDCLLNLRPTRSTGLFRQMVGRIIRTLPGVVDGIMEAAGRRAAIAASAKPDSVILDMLWQTEKFKLVGPASLIAANEQDESEIGKRLRKLRSPEDIEAVSKEYQKAKEEDLRRQLEAVSKRKASLIDARMVGMMINSSGIIEFEPVSKWHTLPISDGQRTFLQRQGINMNTVTGRGHASAIIDVLIKRKENGLASLACVKALASKGIENGAEMTTIDADRILGDETPFPFGKHAGRPFSEIPAGYWNWLEEQDWVAGRWPKVAEHIKKMKQPEIL